MKQNKNCVPLMIHAQQDAAEHRQLIDIIESMLDEIEREKKRNAAAKWRMGRKK